MKGTGIITLALAGTLMFSACQQESDEIITDLDALELEADAAFDATFEEVDQVVETGIDVVSAGNQRSDQSELGSCATITHDDVAQTITIDYGEGCEGRNGNTMAGSIFITYTDKLNVAGATKTVEFVDFYVNDIKVEGVRTITNNSMTDTVREFNTTLEGGKLDFGDGTSATRDASWTRTWYVDEGLVELYGGAAGINVSAVDYSSEISAGNPLTYSRECYRGLPVSGVKTFTVGDDVSVIDFGDGTCDRTVTITVNGETTTEEITPKRGQRGN